MAEISRTSGRVVTFTASGAVILASLVWTACSTANGKTEDRAASALAVSVSPVAVTEQPISRFIRVTGTLTAEEQADVAAETSGRVISTPVERGSPVTEGTELVRLSAVETEASVKEAEANAAQIEARLAQPANGSFDVNRVPEVANARANFALAESEFSRIEKLLAERVVSQSEYDQRKTQVEAARQLLESAKNGAEQQYQALQAARARVTLARKAASDTVVRAPFSGVVVERLVSTGDYVTRGTKVAQVVRIMPLRIALTVPEQFVADVKVGQPVSFSVDAFSGRAFEGRVRYVSPSLRAEQRALTVEAVVPNSNGGHVRDGADSAAQQSAGGPRANRLRPRRLGNEPRVRDCRRPRRRTPRDNRPGARPAGRDHRRAVARRKSRHGQCSAARRRRQGPVTKVHHAMAC
jgi:multidrug efflux pump subunit AcrA (membrane-fusion protein)